MSHRWKFYRAGDVDQVQLRGAEDLKHLGELDPKLWVALAMPTKGIHIDPQTLEAMDLDKDGRVRQPEVLAAVKWAVDALVNPDDLFKGSDTLPVDAIRDPALHSGAKRILHNLGKASASAISLADLADTAKIFADTKFNGDGVVPVSSAEGPELQSVLEDVIAHCGWVQDRSGKPGVDKAHLDAFFADVDALAAWGNAKVLPLGADTVAAAEALSAVQAKVDDFFVRCGLAALDARAAASLAPSEADYQKLALAELSDASDDVARLPLAMLAPGASLPLSAGVNPAWAARVRAFADAAARPMLGGAKTSLTLAEWAQMKVKLAPYFAWQGARPVTRIGALPMERVLELKSSSAKSDIEGLIAQDVALEAETAQVAAVDKLLRYSRDLIRVLHNFVNFSEFYARKGAAFQAGTLYLDGRSCSLCLEVADGGKHGALAAMAGAYLAYCDCVRPGGEKLGIVAAFTDGDSDNLMVGRNGIFFDRKGRDWDATITKLVANPISIREAFWAPYKKVVRLFEEQVGKRAAAADASSHERLKKTAETVGSADALPAADKAAPESKIDVGTVAAIGVALGGIGAMVTGILAAFFGLGRWMPVGLLGVLLVISGPSMLLAFLKLRQRNLGPLLDANGWAINGRARINVPFGEALTDVAALPKGAERSLADPFADKRRPWRLYLFLVALLALASAWYLGKLDTRLPLKARSSYWINFGPAPVPPPKAP